MRSTVSLNSLVLGQLETYWPNDPVAAMVDKLYWRAKNRYVALRGASSAGKSAALNVLLRQPLLLSTEGQTTGCITEIRPVSDPQVSARVHLVSAVHLQERLGKLNERATPDAYHDYQNAAKITKDALTAHGHALAETLTEDAWEALGFSMAMGGDAKQNIVVDRITYPVPVAPHHPLRWAAERGVSFLDLPGDATGETFNEILLEEAATSYPPSVTLRFWRAIDTNQPAFEANDLLVVTFLDAALASPTSNFLSSIRGTMQAYSKRPFVFSAAMDAAPGRLNLGVEFTASAAKERLLAWQSWLEQPERADDPSYQRLLRGLKLTLNSPGGGSAALSEAIQQHLDAADDPTEQSAAVQALAGEVLRVLHSLEQQLAEPSSPDEVARQRKLKDQELRQDRRKQVAQVARVNMYGDYRSEPWKNLAAAMDSESAGSEDSDQAALLHTMVDKHVTAAERDTRQKLSIPDGESRLARIAEPLIRELCGMVAVRGRDGRDIATWTDIARARWELSNLLATLINRADRDWTPDQPVDDEPETEAESAEQPEIVFAMKSGTLAACVRWAESFA